MSQEPHSGQLALLPVEPGKRKKLVWLVGGLVVVAGAGIAFAMTLASGHPGGDPGGVRQAALSNVSVALPGDATVQLHTGGGPIWDSCGGRPGTEGWSDVSNVYEFTSASPADVVVANASAKLKSAGWVPSSAYSSPLGPVVMFTKTVSGNGVASLQLGVANRGPGTPSHWDLSATVPAAGTRVSGC